MKPYFGSTHTHSTGSDGSLTPEKVVKKAIELKWNYVYFTDHYLRPPKSLFKKNNYFNQKYAKEIEKLIKKYKNQIEICFGAEFDWIEEYSDWLKEESKKRNYDYIRGSIHDIFYKKGHYTGIGWTKEEWTENAKKFGGPKPYLKEYYKQTRNLIKSGIYDAVGHLDCIKTSNGDQSLFSENEEWYKKEILKTLDLIQKQKMAIEVNVSGLRKCDSPFPSPWIIKEAKKRNIPITIGADAHQDKHFDNELLIKGIEIIKKAGYKELVRFKKRKMIKMKLK